MVAGEGEERFGQKIGEEGRKIYCEEKEANTQHNSGRGPERDTSRRREKQRRKRHRR